MKLFMFYPNNFCRCYLIGESLEDILNKKEELFIKYIENENPWIDLDDPDEIYYIEDKRKDFYDGIEKIKEVPEGYFFDTHY